MSMISVIIPLFNEKEIIKESYKRLKLVMDSLKEKYELIFINDGSTDGSDIALKELSNNDSNVKVLVFSRNFGHQTAISAGIDFAQGDAIIIIDADLQDPPEVIPEMINKWEKGYEIVYGKRIVRKGETLFKKATAYLFYRLLKSMTNYDIPVDTGDFRLIDKKVAMNIRNLKEKNRYMRGLLSWIGFNKTYVEYIRDKRKRGITKYPLTKMVRFAIDAITSFSYVPLRLASYIGLAVSVLSFLSLFAIIYLKLFTTSTIVGWASLITLSLFFNGLILTILGIIGEYIGRIYDETKCRPLYILKEKIGF